MKTLADLKNGDKAVVIGLTDGSGMQRNLADLGISQGCRMEVISSGGCGRVLLSTSRGRIALGHKMAEKVLVTIKNK
ncbi:MAG: ferrous iron transport protein A [Lentisphaerae bacterium]|nr:ferrous iron transport protein A [Lentisphaerota bacterium]MCP4100803.1 ferrous iron transport protein A [Lentisphaerota bacterium]